MFVLALSLLSPRASACGPDFADRLLDDRVESVLAPPDAVFLTEAHALVAKPAAPFFVREHACWVEPDCRAQRLEIESDGLTSEQAALVARVRLVPSAEEAYALGDGLPEDVRLYTTGAVAFRSDPASSAPWFQRVLALPPEQAQLRGVWAAYMAAELAQQGYSDVRARVSAGARDPLGLAATSLGEEARARWDLREAPGHRWHEEVSAAVALYAEQAAHGSDSGALSLLFLARELVRDPRSVDLAERDPLARRLLVLFLWTRPGEIPRSSAPGSFPEALVDMLQRIELPEEGLDQIAAAAYRKGSYDLAARAAARADGPIAALVRAKLALRAGDLDKAASEYKEAVPGLSRVPLYYNGKSPHSTATGESAVVALARGDYLSALDTLYQAALAASAPQDAEALWFDAAYIAERVLTIDELARYVDENVPEPASLPSQPLDRWTYYGGEYKANYALRWLLARRLMRDNQPARAVPYFDRPLDKAKAVAYAAAYAATADADPVTQASAWLSLSRLTRPGIHLLGTEDVPDYHEVFGDYDLRTSAEGEPSDADVTLPAELAGPDEADRLAQSRPASLERFHYRDLSVDYAMRAASLLPHRSAAYASVMQEAAQRSSHDPERRDAIMRQYYATGPLFYWDGSEPDWQGAREHLAGTWLPPHEREEREKRKKIIASASVLAAAGALLLGGALRASRSRR